MPHEVGHKLGAGDLLGLVEGGDIGIVEALLIGQRFTHVRAADGSIFALDRITGERVSGELAPAAPSDPLKGIEFLTDPNTGTFFAFNPNATNPLDVLTVISEETPEIQRGFQHILEAVLAISEAGIDPNKYNFVFEDGKVVPKLTEQIPPTQDSFSTATDASGQLMVVSRLTGAATPIGATPKASDVPPDGKVELDPETGKFKVTQPDGRISFPATLNPRELSPQVLKGIEIGGQPFAFNPTTGQFQQVRQPDREFDPGVVTRGGRAFIQGPGGGLTPLGREEVPNLSQLIDERIISGDFKGAQALFDFQNQPTSLEAFNAAMQFAKSPGDLAAISAISRGQSLVAPPPSGTVQRIAEQPEILQDAMQRLLSQIRGGGGSPRDLIDVVTRINKEREAELAARKAAERESAAATAKSQKLQTQSQIDAAVKAALKAAGFGAAPPTPVTPPATAPRPGPFGPPGVTSPDEDEEESTAVNPFGGASGGANPFGGGSVFERITGDTPPAGGSTGAAGGSITRTAGVSPPPPPDPIPPVEPEFPPAPPPPSPPDRGDEFLFLEQGGIAGHSLEIVGESGPELVDLPSGTRVTPLRKLSKDKVKKLREMGIKGLQEGGIVEPLLPFGVRRALAGVTIEPTRRRLSRAAGLPVLSAQARQNLLPEELEVFNRLSEEAGIPGGAFRQEQESAFPGANLARGRARFAPRVLR